ncbi:MAG: chromate transporter [Clostridia bacterium]|nr:chromate transporter [Clostridia bacterium]
MIYLQLFIEFFKVGLFSIGGGLATLPFLYNISDRLRWYSHMDLANMIAISESTPGPVGVNTATYVGNTVAGILGSVVATAALIVPSIIIIIIISKFLNKFKDSKHVKNVFYGLRPASVGLIAAAGYSVIIMALLNMEQYNKTGIISDMFNIKAIIFATILLIITNLKKTKKSHPVIFILVSAFIGILFKFN